MSINYNDFTNLYSLQKTLRFELKPVGKTLENLKMAELIEHDEELSQKYQLVKQMINKFHRMHIEESLSLADLNDNIDLLKEYQELYLKGNKNEDDKNKLNEIEKKLRSIVVSFLEGKIKKEKNNKIKQRFTILFSKELFKNDEFLSIAATQEELDAVKSFEKFTTYFKGFQENRKNMYSEDDESTAIAYRIINENLPRFIDNIVRFEKIAKVINKGDIDKLENNLKDELGGYKLNKIFTLQYFENTLTQDGINKYNTILGGKTKKDGVKIQGLNEIVNLFNQNSKDNKLPILKPLYKQILSDDESSSFRLTAFEKDNDVLLSIQEFWDKCVIGARHNITGKKYNLLLSVRALLSELINLNENQLDHMYFNIKNINSISNEVYGEWNIIRDALNLYNISMYENDKNAKNGIKEKDYFSWKEIKDALENYKKSINEDNDIEADAFILFFSEMKVKTEDNEHSSKNIIDLIQEKYENAKKILQEDRGENSNLHQDKQKVGIIKDFLDSLKELQRFLKLLYIDVDIDNMNYQFYNELSVYYETLSPLNSLYNKVRNYMTRKPFSQEKFALTFNSPTLLDGWDLNKETSNLGIILRKDGKYYLGIMNKGYNRVFENYDENCIGDYYEKMVYKLLPGPNKMLPKVFFSNKGLEYYKPSRDILNLYENEEFKKGDTFNKKSLHRLIDFYKQAISMNEDWKTFNFHFRSTNEYEDISQFYKDVEEQGYKIIFKKVSTSYINQLVNDGKLYLFQIYNKDFSPFSKGNPNLHTIYWNNVFSEENLKNVVYKLNGEAEVFYRKKSIDYPDEIKAKGHHADVLKGKFKYPIIKDKRYSEDKFLFHVPITMNFTSKNKNNINEMVRDYIATTSDDIHIIGIDRGERHLLYLSMIDLKGNIVDQKSLNMIHIEKYNKDINYQQKLDVKEKERTKARQNWDIVENIKELKEGYLSQVIHQIAKMMVEHKAILVMEDLNVGFKRGRFKVEKQVYQKFEKMLIDKLNYLVFKDKIATEPGGSLRAFQLAAPFESFKKLGKQCGMIFYVPARYTSKIDPTTGFYNFLNIDTSTLQKAKETFNKFDKILYNSKEDYFEFYCKYGSFVTAAQNNKGKSAQTGKTALKFYDSIKDTKWIICSTSHVRYKKIKNKKGYIETIQVNVNEELKKIFEENGIDYRNHANLKEIIINSDNAKFLKQIGENLKLLVLLRYNNGKSGEQEQDFILSPIKNNQGTFYYTLASNDNLPVDADANGAYNIALKGLLLINKIKNSKHQKGKVDLFISNYEWISFLLHNRIK